MKKTVIFPECWEEVKPLEWIFLLKLRWALMFEQEVNLRDVKRAWCAYVLKNRGEKINSKSVDDMHLVDSLADTLSWMWNIDEENRTIELTYNTTVNLLPVFGKFVGPLSHGGDLSFGEFRHATTLMNQYNQTHDLNLLRALAGTLYRPRKKGRREPFDMNNTSKYIQRMHIMPEYVLYGVYAWFAYFCQYLISEPFIIEGKQLSFAPVFKGEKKEGGPAQDIGMNSILFSVAESGIFGNVDNTDNTSLMRVMMKLLDDKQRADALLQRSKK